MACKELHVETEQRTSVYLIVLMKNRTCTSRINAARALPGKWAPTVPLPAAKRKCGFKSHLHIHHGCLFYKEDGGWRTQKLWQCPCPVANIQWVDGVGMPGTFNHTDPILLFMDSESMVLTQQRFQTCSGGLDLSV